MKHFDKRTWVEVDLDAIEYNYKTIRKRVPTSAKLCCVVKADAYGHGAVRVATLLKELGADFFAVATFEEALQLRNADIDTPILVLGYTPPIYAKQLAENNISQCVYSSEYAAELNAEALASGVKISVHMKLDVGMGRLGFIFTHDTEQSFDELLKACKCESFVLEGIFTHFPCADEEKKKSSTRHQFERFYGVVSKLEGLGYSFAIRHCANTAASLAYPEFSLDMTRAGISLYGALPSDFIGKYITPKCTFTLKTVVTNVKTVKEGDTIGYGSRFAAPKDMRIATLPIGYADGFLRTNAKSGTKVFIGGHPCGIVGRVCMDQTMINADDVDGISIGDEVIIFGGEGAADVHEFAKINKTIPYETLCTVGARVPRIYKKDGVIEFV